MEYSTSETPSMSSDIRLLAQAFLLAKKEFSVTGLGGSNLHQKYKYAKLGDIYNAVEGALANNQIIIWHYAALSEQGEILRTRLIHAPSGQFIEDARLLESEKPGNQGKGAANTYMKKYALLSLCAIATEDDDGEDEERYIAKQPSISAKQLAMLQNDIKEAANNKVLYANILRFNKVSDLRDLKAATFESVRTYVAQNKE